MTNTKQTKNTIHCVLSEDFSYFICDQRLYELTNKDRGFRTIFEFINNLERKEDRFKGDRKWEICLEKGTLYVTPIHPTVKHEDGVPVCFVFNQPQDGIIPDDFLLELEYEDNMIKHLYDDVSQKNLVGLENMIKTIHQ